MDKTDHDLLVEINTRLIYLVENQNDHERRIRTLEIWRWKQVGIVSLVSSILGSGGVIGILALMGVL